MVLTLRPIIMIMNYSVADLQGNIGQMEGNVENAVVFFLDK